MGAGEKRGLTMLTGRLGLDMLSLGEIRGERVLLAFCGQRQPETAQTGTSDDIHGRDPHPFQLMSPSSSKTSAPFATEFDILKASHKFLREDQDPAEAHNPSWNDQLAQKYYGSLFREFAVCDLKHYKSGNV